jgi:uncharacterized protein with HEPN domain
VSRDWRLFLDDMREAADSVLSEMDGLSRDRFDEDARLRKIILHDFLVMGEAAKHIPDETRARYPKVPWRKIAGLRDVIAHSYFSLDVDVIWNIAASVLPEVRPMLERIIRELPEEPTDAN